MFYRTLGKAVFYFVVVPKIVDNLRIVRKHAEPQVREMIAQGYEKVSKDFAEMAKDNTPNQS